MRFLRGCPAASLDQGRWVGSAGQLLFQALSPDSVLLNCVPTPLQSWGSEVAALKALAASPVNLLSAQFSGPPKNPRESRRPPPLCLSILLSSSLVPLPMHILLQAVGAHPRNKETMTTLPNSHALGV